MNLSLLDPFVLAQDCPEAVTGTMRSGHSTVMRFNHRGDSLASGRLDGAIAIFDIETTGVARKLKGHVRQVSSLSWSANDRYLLSGSHDWNIILWDLLDGSRIRTIRCESPIFVAELHPKNHLLFLAALFDASPVLIDLSDQDNIVKRTFSSLTKQEQEEAATTNGNGNGVEETAPRDKTKTAEASTIYAQFTPQGTHILSGTNKGYLHIISTSTCQTIYSTRITQSIIYLLRLSSSGRSCLTNSSDRIIRTINLPDLDDPSLSIENIHLQPEHKFQDLVNKLSWNYVTFSAQGDYVAASTYNNHDVYVWERTHGSLVKILENPKEEMQALEWAPHKPFIAASGTESGRIYLWSILTPQRWSALAPDFLEVEENLEYVEKEDEFDIQPIEEVRKMQLDREDEVVDVLTVETVKGAEWAELGEFVMPILLGIEGDVDSEEEVVAVGAGVFRKKGGAAQGENEKSKRRRVD